MKVLTRSSAAVAKVTTGTRRTSEDLLARSLAREWALPQPERIDLEEVLGAEDPQPEEDTESSSGAEAERITTKIALDPKPRRCLMRAPVGDGGGDLVLLEGCMSPRTVEAYHTALQAFMSFVRVWHLAIVTVEDKDVAMVKFLGQLFHRGYDLNVGERVVAALIFNFQRLSRCGDLTNPRVHRALLGWRRLAPAKSRTPLTFYVVAALSALVAKEGYRLMALWCLISFGTYFKPGSMMQLTRSSFLAPVTGSDLHWKVLTHQCDLGQRRKPCTRDDTLPWDVPDLLWLQRAFEFFTQGGSRLWDASTWPFTYAQFALRLGQAGEKLGLKVVPYQLRHSGASWDAAKKYRTLSEIQARGGWRSTTSALRFDKSGKMWREYSKLSVDRRQYCEQVANKLCQYTVEGQAVPSPPS